mmetsp:Transcript_8830/g.15023  ORF Transcript_8830/g.15023 Transcript_8830/m.15023 type:complete len:313 (+) Transcript_8830:41-979(+)
MFSLARGMVRTVRFTGNSSSNLLRVSALIGLGIAGMNAFPTKEGLCTPKLSNDAKFLEPSAQRPSTILGTSPISGGSDRLAIKPQALPRVFLYDHCPYCTRVRIILGLKNIKHELVWMANDDFDTPISLVGKKMAPIFEYNSEEWGHEVMAESLDIIARLDSDPKWGPPLLRPASDRTDFRNWINDNKVLYNRLVNPRYARSPLIPEFTFQEAREVYVKRHPLPAPSDYDVLFAMSPQFVEEMNEKLLELEPMIFSAEHCTAGGLSVDDVELFSRLRGLTVVRGLSFPPKVKAYIETMSQKTKVPLYYQLAI